MTTELLGNNHLSLASLHLIRELPNRNPLAPLNTSQSLNTDAPACICKITACNAAQNCTSLEKIIQNKKKKC